MPPRSVKMKRFIFGFQRRVWWPKWTPASSNSFMETTGMGAPFSGFDCVAPVGPGGSRVETAATVHMGFPACRRDGKHRNGTGPCLFPVNPRYQAVGNVLVELPGALSALGAELRANGWELALEVVEEGLTDDV